MHKTAKLVPPGNATPQCAALALQLAVNNRSKHNAPTGQRPRCSVGATFMPWRLPHCPQPHWHQDCREHAMRYST